MNTTNAAHTSAGFDFSPRGPESAELAGAVARLHARLEQQALDARLLDLAYTTVDTPVGSLLLAATETGLLRVAYDIEGHDSVLDTLAARVGARILRAPKRLDAVAFELDEYFAGTRRVFDVPLDLSLSSGFRQLVQRHLPGIAYGSTETYKEVALLVGNPRAVRAVGSACATNPLPVVVPCHRVLRSDGGLGGYIGGLAAKTALLELEGRVARG
ncbi:cysteine methyltransferase [Subtercola boreus]|uniref:Methylated-DNA--protein-cysteine methyltransferase n=1 Tax=Subtercola boreus TaxID=120213 RepID=A0A3E0VGC6_9MICO|nr:methylated-DNA--[protein]-cysteine S-methyltransferase [Subtercola boreus]RFA07927.1 cysteine methyltransferase [Subtercola boreus]TQL55211.1 methylated-DNA-[protein]-cysteine S-methyltransferase [Subtercola boreus]